MCSKKRDYKRHIFIIDAKFQLKFSFYICLILVLSSIIYPLTLDSLMNNILGILSTNFPEVAKSLSIKWRSLLIVIVLWQVGIASLIFIICIFISHRIVGPLYKLKKYLSGIRQGTSSGKLVFRKGDNFQDLAEVVNETFEGIQEEYRSDFAYISEVNNYLNSIMSSVPEDKQEVLGEITKKLTEIQNRFNNI